MALQQEIRMLESLERATVQGVMTCLDIVDIDGKLGMVMPFYPAHLGAWLKKVNEDPSEDTLDDILKKTATISRILAHMHGVSYANGLIIHRDVKPENIFLDDEDRLILGDFGGAMTITSLEAVELALFGTPMWAPLDQILPGKAIPDPTWDTYALCVILYGALTGSRPAYQSDPTSLLTHRGQKLWKTATDAIRGIGLDSQTKRAEFITARAGTLSNDLIDLTGHSALNDADRDLLDKKVSHLAQLASIPQEKHRLLQRGLWDLLCRGLSPVSHPSPPNRYRNAAAMAEQIEDIRDLLHNPTTASLKTTQSPTTIRFESSPQPSNLRTGFGTGCWIGTILFLGVTLAILLGVVLWPSGTPAWVAGDYKIEVPPQVISVALPATSPSAGNKQDWVGRTVLVRGSVMDFEGGNRLTFYYDAETLIETPTVTLENADVQGPIILSLPTLVAGRGQVTVNVPIPAKIPSGPYRIEYQPKEILPLVRATVTRITKRKVHFKQWSAPVRSVLAVFNDVQTEPINMDKCEVSQKRWMRCVSQKRCVALPDVSHSQLPIVVSDPNIADQFCKSKGGRLPTVAEWTAAAGDGFYPWGSDRPKCDLANGLGCGGSLRNVCTTPKGTSPYGVHDLAGNVREWVWVDETRTRAKLVGGSFTSGPQDLGKTSVLYPPKDYTSRDAGFRCVYPMD